MISPNNLLCSQSDGTTDGTTSHLTNPAKDAGQVIGYSHSTRSPKNGNQVAGYAASRARSFHAYPFDMSRRSLMKQLAIRLSQQAGKSLVMRGSLHLGLLATVLWGNQ
jgi:hypothetical protein